MPGYYRSARSVCPVLRTLSGGAFGVIRSVRMDHCRLLGRESISLCTQLLQACDFGIRCKWANLESQPMCLKNCSWAIWVALSTWPGEPKNVQNVFGGCGEHDLVPAWVPNLVFNLVADLVPHLASDGMPNLLPYLVPGLVLNLVPDLVPDLVPVWYQIWY